MVAGLPGATLVAQVGHVGLAGVHVTLLLQLFIRADARRLTAHGAADPLYPVRLARCVAALAVLLVHHL